MSRMMQDDGMKCPRCQSEKISKNGRKNGKQRFLCKACRHQFAESHVAPAYDEAFKKICLQAYRNGKSFREIERVYDVHHTTVISWVKQAGFDLSDLARSSLDRSTLRSQAISTELDGTTKREAILIEALHVFASRGYQCASMSQIASASGISDQALYAYFEDKESLFSALIQQFLDKAAQSFLSLSTESNSSNSPKVALKRVAIALITAFSEDQQLSVLVRLLIGESGRFPELARHFVREVEKPMSEQLSTYLRFHPDVQIGDPLVATRMFMGSLMHYSMIQDVLQGQDILPLERDRMVDGLINSIMAP